MQTVVSSDKKEVIIGHNRTMVLIGERINTTGKKEMRSSLKRGDMKLIQKEAVSQVDAGADIIDINVNIDDYDEKLILPKAVQAVMDVTDAPICIDSSNPKAIEAALKVYKGRALINSVTGEKGSLDTILPLARDFGASVIGLPIDENGIPQDPIMRLEIAKKIIEKGMTKGIPESSFVIDGLVQSIGTNHANAIATLETVRKLKNELSVNIVAAVSNISFGLPGRYLLNSSFFSMVMYAEASCAILDVANLNTKFLACNLLLGKDLYARRYTEAYRKTKR